MTREANITMKLLFRLKLKIDFRRALV